MDVSADVLRDSWVQVPLPALDSWIDNKIFKVEIIISIIEKPLSHPIALKKGQSIRSKTSDVNQTSVYHNYSRKSIH